MSKPFPTADVLGTITGKLLASIGGIYDVCSYASGESVFTHQLPRICREVRDAMLKIRPDLQQAVDESTYVNGDNYREWFSKWTGRYGDTIEVPEMSRSEHERIDALSELSEMVHPSKIIVAEITK